MASFFINPFSTQIGQRIEQATDASLASENWALNMEICDMINESSDTAREAMKAIRKRLNQNAGKNFQVILYTLTLVETCVKNCGKAFHVLVANKEFIQDLVKIIGPKNDPPATVQEKVLSLIQIWAKTFQNQPDLTGVVQIYQELKTKGIEFPESDTSLAPIYTPQRSVPEPVPAQPPQSSPSATAHVPTGPANLTPEQALKLQSELDVVSMNMSVLGEMLTELKPGQESPADYKLLNDLTLTCKEMQGRIVELIGRVSNDEITAELLRLNDELNNLFLRHQRYEKNRDPNAVGSNLSSPSAILGAAIGLPTKKEEIKKDELIDLSDNASGFAAGAENLSNQFSGLGMGELSKINKVSAASGSTSITADEFDILAQSRNVVVTDTSNKTSKIKEIPDAGNNNVLKNDQVSKKVISTKESEFDEMAAWLKNSKDDKGTEETITSTEFDKFLAERAAAAEQLPTLTNTTTVNNNESTGNKKKDKTKDEDSLLAI